MAKERLDKLLLSKNLVSSRQRAQALILAGKVLVNETVVSKTGTRIDEAATIRVKDDDNPFVSRGGLKLAGALEHFGVDPRGLTVLDVGASTGGFTDYCLQHGAVKVYAIDVGTNQLDWKLRSDPRVVSIEKFNAKKLTPAMFEPLPDMVVMDVSFISTAKLLPAVLGCIKPGGLLIPMVKPQFEVGRDKVGKGGVVRDEQTRQEAAQNVVSAAKELGVEFLGQVDSNVTGPKGNREIFLHLKTSSMRANQPDSSPESN